MSNKEEILKAIRENGFKNPKATGEASVDPHTHINNESDDLVAEFITRITENKSFVIQSSAENLAKDINEIFVKEGVKNLIYPEGLPVGVDELAIDGKFKFDVPVEEFKERIFEYDVSVINTRYGVSSHGLCCVASSKEQPRLLSLTPKVCIMLVKKENVVKSIAGALRKIKDDEGGRLPTNVVFISGPSRTADIELVPVLGVHGSQIAYVVVY